MQRIACVTLISLLLAPVVVRSQPMGHVGVTLTVSAPPVVRTMYPAEIARANGEAATAVGAIVIRPGAGVVYSLPDGPATGRLYLGGSPDSATLAPVYRCTAAADSRVVASRGSVHPATCAAGSSDYLFVVDSLAPGQARVRPGRYAGTIRVRAAIN